VLEEALIPAVRRSAALTMYWKIHRAVYKATNGRISGKGKLPVLLLTTTGRKTGQPRTVALYYLEDDGNPVVIGSNVGEDVHPVWWLNLRSAPEATVQIGRDKFPVTAREAEGEERERLWQRVIEIDPSYATYQERTDRRIPVVVLSPASMIART
jgi:deazaflavin-dependent oxidoreductase (nitroreductase family)